MEKYGIQELLQFIAQDIPAKKETPIGFLELISKSRDETINSKIYEFFLNHDNKKLAKAFLDALINLIHKDGKFEAENMLIEISNRIAFTEITTEAKNRIDLVIQGNHSVIIIENKIHHHLDNPLDDYWDHFDSRTYPQKIGIVLTLEPLSIPEKHREKYINITHIDWINEIKNNGLPHGINPKMYIYLNDFFNTIESLTKSTEMNERARFYLQNAKKAREIINIATETGNFIGEQIDILADKSALKPYASSSEKGYYRALWKPNHPIYIGILWSQLLEGENYFIIRLETNGGKEYAHKIQEYLKKGGGFYNTHKSKGIEILNPDNSNPVNLYKRKLHLDLDKLQNIADLIYDFIKEVDLKILEELMNEFPEKE